MSDLTDPWSSYGLLQAELARRNQVDNRSWGLEAGLNGFLKSAQGSPPLTNEDMSRAVAGACRRERNRARLRLVHLSRNVGTAHPEAAFLCRHELLAIEAQLVTRDWALLCAVAEGEPYKNLAIRVGLTSGNLRVRVLRIRRQIGERLAA